MVKFLGMDGTDRRIAVIFYIVVEQLVLRFGSETWIMTFKRLQNQRPKVVVPTDISTSVKEILLGNVLLLETLIVNLLPASETF